MEEDKIKLGAALIDPRPAEEKKSDYTDEELASGTSPEPFKNKRIKKLTATVFNQWYTSSCVFHGFLTALEYEGIITKDEVKSQLRAYRKRVNYPAEGSIAYDAWDKIRAGVSPYADAPTKEKMTETQANAMSLVAGDPVLKERFNYFQVTDYSRIAEYVTSGKAVPVFIYGTKQEWSQEYVELLKPELGINDSDTYVRHCVTLIPKGDFTEDGVQYFSVHDSSAFGNRQLRYMPLNFLLKRSYYAGRIEPKNTAPVEPPVVDRIPDVPCALNDKGDAVFALQRFLFDDGKLKGEYVTGFYGVLTAKAVMWYQLSRWQKFTSTIPELLDLKGEYWGQQSINTLSN